MVKLHDVLDLIKLKQNALVVGLVNSPYPLKRGIGFLESALFDEPSRCLWHER